MDRDGQIRRMRERAARALRRNREISCRGIRGRTKDDGSAQTRSDIERAGGIRGDTRGKRAEGKLHDARESIDRVCGNAESGACTALLDRNGIGRERQRKIGNRRRRLSHGRGAVTATGPRRRKQRKQQHRDATTESSHKMTPQTFRAETPEIQYGRLFPGDACAKLRKEPGKTIQKIWYLSSLEIKDGRRHP